MNAFAHIPAAILAAFNNVGIHEAGLENTYAYLRKQYAADKVSADDGKILLAMTLAHHVGKYSKDYVRKGSTAGMVHNSALERKVHRDWKERIVGETAADAATVRVNAEERAAYDELVAALAKANAKFAKACGARAAAVRKTMAARAKAAK